MRPVVGLNEYHAWAWSYFGHLESYAGLLRGPTIKKRSRVVESSPHYANLRGSCSSVGLGEVRIDDGGFSGPTYRRGAAVHQKPA